MAVIPASLLNSGVSLKRTHEALKVTLHDEDGWRIRASC